MRCGFLLVFIPTRRGSADLLRHSVAAKRLTEITRSCRADGLVSTAEPHWFLPLIGFNETVAAIRAAAAEQIRLSRSFRHCFPPLSLSDSYSHETSGLSFSTT